MEHNKYQDSSKVDSAEALPSLIDVMTLNAIVGFDSIEMNRISNNQSQFTTSQPASPLTKGTEAAVTQSSSEECQPIRHQRTHSISMPSSPLTSHLENTKRVTFSGAVDGLSDLSATTNSSGNGQPKPPKFHSQPISQGSAYTEAATNRLFSSHAEQQPRNPNIDRLKDRRFDSFKTWSGKLERQLSHLRGKPRETEQEDSGPDADIETLPVDRYFDALEGPELETLRDSEELVLPEDKKWPFLLRYPISSFGICLGVSSQAILWKTLATSPSTSFLHVSLDVNLILWCIAVALVAIVSFVYFLKIILFFEAVRREYYHPIRVNFFFAPWIALLFLLLGVPPSVATHLHAVIWYILMTPIFCLELKIYGQWMSGGQRRLSKVANPSNHLSIVGNFVGALLGASMGLKEGPIFFFAVGLAHYTVLFVTLYQRLPTNETLPKELHPVFFLFVAAPSVASMAWAKINGSFDFGSRITYFIALFLYFSLAVRVNFFRGFRFSVAWWAYTFPMTGAAVATIRYSNEVTNAVTRSLSIILSAIATVTVSALLVMTILRAFVFRDLFPNDIAIAISDQKPKMTRKRFHLRHGSSETKHIETYLKCVGSDSKDIEAALNSLNNMDH